MFKAFSRAVPRAAKQAQGARPAVWEDALRKLYTTHTANVRRSPGQIQSRARLLKHSATRPSFVSTQNVMRQGQRRGFRLSRFWRSQSSGNVKEDTSLMQRIRKLSKEYGKAVIVVYFILSVLDYPFFFLLVRVVGTERIGVIEHHIMSVVTSVVPEPVRKQIREYYEAARDVVKRTFGYEVVNEAEMVGWGVEEAEERHREEASLATQLALAYAIHKSFIFIRVPLTAAVTPKVVKTLRSWGWNIGKPK